MVEQANEKRNMKFILYRVSLYTIISFHIAIVS